MRTFTTVIFLTSLLIAVLARLSTTDLQSTTLNSIEHIQTDADLQSVTSSRQQTILDLALESPEEAIAFARSTREVLQQRISTLGLSSSTSSIEHDFLDDEPNTSYTVRRHTICGDDDHHHQHHEEYILKDKTGSFFGAIHATSNALSSLSAIANIPEESLAQASNLDGVRFGDVAVLSSVSTLSSSSTSTSSSGISDSSVCSLPSPEADVNGVSPMRATNRLRLRARNVIIYIVKFTDTVWPTEGATPVDVAYMQAQMNEVDEFWQNMTDGALSLGLCDIIMVDFPQSSSTYTGGTTSTQRSQLTDDVITYVNSDNTLSNNGEYDGSNAKYHHRIVVMDAIYAAEGWAGIAHTPGLNVWAQVDFRFRVFAHEIGHNFGLGHANVISHDSDISTWTELASTNENNSAYFEYKDELDTMSGSESNATYFFSAAQLHYLRILDNKYIANAATLGYAAENTVIYNLAAIDDARTQPYLKTHSPDWYYTYAALHIPLTNSCSDAGLWLEYRGNLHNPDHRSSEYMYNQYASNNALHGYIRFDYDDRYLNYIVSAVELNENLRDSDLNDAGISGRFYETTIQPGDTWTCPSEICAGTLRVTVVGSSSPASGETPGMMAVRVHSAPAEDTSDEPAPVAVPADTPIKVNGWVPAHQEEVDIAASSLAVSNDSPYVYYYLSPPDVISGLDGTEWQALEVSPKMKTTFSAYTSFVAATSPLATCWNTNVSDAPMKKAIRGAGGNLITPGPVSSSNDFAFSVVNRDNGAHALYEFAIPRVSNLAAPRTLNTVEVNLSVEDHGLACEVYNFNSAVVTDKVQDEYTQLGLGPAITLSGVAGGVRTVSIVEKTGNIYKAANYITRMDWIHPAFAIQPDYTSSDKVLITPLFPPKGLSLFKTLPMNAVAPPSYSFGDLTRVVAPSDNNLTTLEFLAASPAQNKWHKACVYAPYTPSGNTIMDIDWALRTDYDPADVDNTEPIPQAAVLSLARWPTDNEFDPLGSMSFELFRSGSRSIYTTGARISILSATSSAAIEEKPRRFFSSRLNIFDWIAKDSSQSWNYICISLYNAPGQHMTITSPRIYELSEVVDSITTDITTSTSVPSGASADPVLKSANAFKFVKDSNLVADVGGNVLSYPDDDSVEDTTYCALGLSESNSCPYTLSVTPNVAVSSAITTSWGTQTFGTRTANEVASMPVASGSEDSPVTASASSNLSNLDPGSTSVLSVPLVEDLGQSAAVVLGGSFFVYALFVVLFWYLIRECIFMIFGCMLKDEETANPVVVAVKGAGVAATKNRSTTSRSGKRNSRKH